MIPKRGEARGRGRTTRGQTLVFRSLLPRRGDHFLPFFCYPFHFDFYSLIEKVAAAFSSPIKLIQLAFADISTLHWCAPTMNAPSYKYSPYAPYSQSMNRPDNRKFLEYRMIKQIGEGAFSKVFLANHTPSRRKVALKIVNVSCPFPFQMSTLSHVIWWIFSAKNWTKIISNYATMKSPSFAKSNLTMSSNAGMLSSLAEFCMFLWNMSKVEIWLFTLK